MPVSVDFIPIGIQKFEHRLASVESEFRDKVIQRGLSAAALIVEGHAKDRVPVRTGTLKRSIGQGPAGPNAVKIGTNVPYAARLEYGFIGKDKLGRRYNQPPRPYLRPALRESKGEVRETFVAEVNRSLRSAR